MCSSERENSRVLSGRPVARSTSRGVSARIKQGETSAATDDAQFVGGEKIRMYPMGTSRLNHLRFLIMRCSRRRYLGDVQRTAREGTQPRADRTGRSPSIEAGRKRCGARGLGMLARMLSRLFSICLRFAATSRKMRMMSVDWASFIGVSFSGRIARPAEGIQSR
jgi:hypothetical protein